MQRSDDGLALTDDKMRTFAILVFFAGAITAHAQVNVTVDFDDLPNGTPITNQYPNAVFSTVQGFEVRAHETAESHSPPNAACGAEVGGPVYCSVPMYIDFPLPVDNIGMWLTGFLNFEFGRINIYEEGSLAATYGYGGWWSIYIDFPQHRSITRIELIPVNHATHTLDDLTYTYREPVAIPALSDVGIAIFVVLLALTGALLLRLAPSPLR